MLNTKLGATGDLKQTNVVNQGLKATSSLLWGNLNSEGVREDIGGSLASGLSQGLRKEQG